MTLVFVINFYFICNACILHETEIEDKRLNAGLPGKWCLCVLS